MKNKPRNLEIVYKCESIYYIGEGCMDEPKFLCKIKCCL